MAGWTFTGWDLGASVGAPIPGASNNCVLYIDSAGLLACDTPFIYNGEDKLSVGKTSFENWANVYSVIQIGGNSSLWAHTAEQASMAFGLLQNAYRDGAANYRYVSADESSQYYQQNGEHRFYTAPSGAVDAVITWNQSFTIRNNTNSGHVSIGKDTFENWAVTYSVLQLGGMASLMCFTGELATAPYSTQMNAYWDNSNWRYIINNEASQYEHYEGRQTFRNASGGAADSVVTWNNIFLMFNNAGAHVSVGKTTEENWSVNYSVVQIGGNSALMADLSEGASKSLSALQNAYYDGVNYKYVSADEATRYYAEAGAHEFLTAPSGAADANISWNTGVKITNIGGIAVLRTNRTGSNTVKGQLVKTDTANDDGVILCAVSDTECIGVFLDAGVSNGSLAWVVIGGVADVAFEDNTASTRGDWVGTSTTDAGYAVGAGSPPAAPRHFEEIGHCNESVAAGGAGVRILGRCILHFN